MDPTESEGLDLHHVAPLGNDGVPDQNQAHYCMSCDFPMQGLYCVQCGQKNDDYRRSIFSLIKEFITSITAIESRIWRTWSTLIFKPGKVAREYADGRRNHWSSPIRVYLAMSILLFGFMSFTNTHLFSIDIDAKVKEGVEKPFEELSAEDIETKFQTHFFETQAAIDRRNANRDFSLIQKKFTGEDANFNVNISPVGIQNNVEFSEDEKAEIEKALEDTPEGVREFVQGFIDGASGDTKPEAEGDVSDDSEVNDAIEDTDDSVVDGPMINGQQLTKEDGVNMLVRFMKNPIMLTRSFNNRLPQLMFFMMPFTMLIGAMFIRGRGNALLYDHLVHAAYIHAFAFFLLFSGIVLSKFLSGEIVFRIIWVVILVYLPVSLKKMFQRGWFKTIWTAYGVGFIYVFILSIAMMALITQDISADLANRL